MYRGIWMALACAGCLGAERGQSEVPDGAPDEADGGASSGALVTQLHIGDGSALVATAAGVDDVFVAGAFAGTIELDGTTLEAEGDRDLYVARVAPDGTVAYAFDYGGDGSERPLTLAVNPASLETVVVGLYDGEATAGGNTFPSSPIDAMFVAGYDDDGGHRWSFHGMSPALVLPTYGITLGGGGDALLAGYFDTSLDLPGTTLSGDGGHDVFYARVDQTGTVVEPRRYGSSAAETVTGAVAGPLGSSVFFMGNVEQDFMIGDRIVPGPGTGVDGYVASVLESGTVTAWVTTLPGAGRVLFMHGAPRPDGGVVVAGWFDGELDLALPEPRTFTARGIDFFLASLDAAGMFQWGFPISGPGSDYSSQVAVGDDGAIWLIGTFEGTIDVAGTSLESKGGSDIMIARFEPDGQLVWARAFGGPLDDLGISVAAGPDGSIYAAVLIRGLVDFGGDDPLGATETVPHAAMILLR